MSHAAGKTGNERDNDSDSRGKVYVVGTGPGDLSQLTGMAREALARSAVIVGYKRYVELIEGLIAGKKVVSSGMKEEISRCEEALKLAEEGEIVSLVSSGDPGVYGMAGLLLELNRDGGLEIEIVPGVSAVNAAASLVGAPLMHDFAVVSLSDLLTPWDVIEKRVKCAAEGDFVIALYNPKSKKRVEQILKTSEIIKKYRSG